MNKLSNVMIYIMSLSSMIKTGFGLTVGSIVAILIFMGIGIGLFIGGFVMVTKEMKKPADKRNKAMLIVGFVMMGLGLILGLGFGASIFFELLGDSI